MKRYAAENAPLAPDWAFPVLHSENRETPMRAEAVIKGDRLSDAKPLHYNKTQPAGVAWVEWSEIQEVTAATILGNRSLLDPGWTFPGGRCEDSDMAQISPYPAATAVGLTIAELMLAIQ